MAPIETYIVINIVMNFAIIGIVARIRGRVVWQRVAFASGFGCVYAIAMESGWFPRLNYLVFKVALAVVITLVAVKADGIWSLVSGTLMLLGATVFVGGVVSMSVRIFGQNTVSMLAGAIAGLVSLLAATEFRTRRLDRWKRR